MRKRSGTDPRVPTESGGHGVVSQASAVRLIETARKSGLDTAISAALAPGDALGRCTIRAKSCWIWRSQSR